MSSKSTYKNLRMIRDNVKIYKFQNQRSAIDLSHILNSYREKGEDNSVEYDYSGRICFSIFSNKTYLKAYLKKSKAKALFQSVVSGSFQSYYSGKYQDFGGGVKDGKVFSNKLGIRVEEYNGRKKVIFEIEEMPGKRTSTGAYKPTGKAYAKSTSMLDLPDFFEMSIEALDFIRAAEVVGMQKGKPLHTLTSVKFESVEEPEVKSNVVPINKNAQSNNKPINTMERKEFYDYYVDLKAKFDDAQAEYDRRVENSPKNITQN